MKIYLCFLIGLIIGFGLFIAGINIYYKIQERKSKQFYHNAIIFANALHDTVFNMKEQVYPIDKLIENIPQKREWQGYVDWPKDDINPRKLND